MPSLLQLVVNLRALSPQEIHPHFRLILSSAPCNAFPSDVLSNSVKLTCEPPSGLRANLLRCVTKWRNVYAPSTTLPVPTVSHPLWERLLQALCYFHAVVIERKKFGALGWNVDYEFNDSDLDVSITTLRMFLVNILEGNYADNLGSKGITAVEAIPWNALQHVIGEVLYGGRVTDQWDSRCLSSILKRYLSSDIFTASSHLPPFSLLSHAEISEGPEVFGMDQTADKVSKTHYAETIIQTLAVMQPAGATLRTPAGRAQNQLVASLSEMLASLPPLPSQSGDYHSSLRDEVQPAPLTTFLRQEVGRYSRLLATIRSTLAELLRAIRGLAVMSLEMEDMLRSILSHSIPAAWSHVSYPSTKPLLAFIRDLHARVAFIREWVVSGCPASFWLSGFFFPQGFLTGLLQTTARKNKLPVDTLAFEFRILDEYGQTKIKDSPREGAYVYGLQLSGARWDPIARALGDTQDGEIFSPFPIVHLVPCQNCILSFISFPRLCFVTFI
jgi:dynein heavy chain